MLIQVTLKIPLQSGIKRDFESLINNSKLSDYTIKVGGRDFFVHKAILAGKFSITDFENVQISRFCET